MQYTKEQKKEIYALLMAKLDMALDDSDEKDPDEVKHRGKEVVWQNIAFLLDVLNQGDFFGVLSIKMSGSKMYDIRQLERNFRLEGYYIDFLKKLNNMKDSLDK